MRERISLFVILCVVSPGIQARGIEDIISALTEADNYHGRGRFEVYLPSSQEPVAYDIDLLSTATGNDTLSPCSYIITWQLQDSPRSGEGFSAYFDGNFYNFRDKRLKEYHRSASWAVFAPNGSARKGVQQQTQFASLLPQIIAQELNEIAADTTYTYNITETARGVSLNGKGAGREFSYLFDSSTLMPASATITYNPGAVSEQSTVWQVNKTEFITDNNVFSEENLARHFQEAFEKYRSSTFRAENLPGEELPGFSAPVAGGREHYTYEKGEALNTLTLIVFLDPEVASTATTVKQVRSAAAKAPVPVQIIWTFPTTNRAYDILKLIAPGGDDEVALSSARAFASACGITLYPTLIIVNKDGIVKDVVIGANQDLATIVIQKIAIKTR